MSESSTDRDIAWVDQLRELGTENALVEFKRSNGDPEIVGKLISALSNAAREADKEVACVIWGIEDQSGKIVGTDFSPDAERIGGQAFELRLAQLLKPSPAFSFRTVNHPEGRLVFLEIPAASIAPIEYQGTAYIRVGNATPKLSDYPERFQKLITNLRPFVWEKGIAKAFVDSDQVLDLLDYPSYFKLTGQKLPDGRSAILERLEADYLGSGLTDHSQKSTVAASARAEKKTVGQRSYRVATRRQSLRRPNMISMRLRRLYRRLSYLTGMERDFRPGMQGLMNRPGIAGGHPV